MNFKEIFEHAFSDIYGRYHSSESDDIYEYVMERTENMKKENKPRKLEEITVPIQERKKRSKAPAIAAAAVLSAAGIACVSFYGARSSVGIEITPLNNTPVYTEEVSETFEAEPVIMETAVVMELPEEEESSASEQAAAEELTDLTQTNENVLYADRDDKGLFYDFGSCVLRNVVLDFDGMTVDAQYELEYRNEIPEEDLTSPRILPVDTTVSSETHNTPGEEDMTVERADNNVLRIKTKVCYYEPIKQADICFTDVKSSEYPTKETVHMGLAASWYDISGAMTFETLARVDIGSSVMANLYSVSLSESCAAFKLGDLDTGGRNISPFALFSPDILLRDGTIIGFDEFFDSDRGTGDTDTANGIHRFRYNYSAVHTRDEIAGFMFNDGKITVTIPDITESNRLVSVTEQIVNFSDLEVRIKNFDYDGKLLKVTAYISGCEDKPVPPITIRNRSYPSEWYKQDGYSGLFKNDDGTYTFWMKYEIPAAGSTQFDMCYNDEVQTIWAYSPGTLEKKVKTLYRHENEEETSDNAAYDIGFVVLTPHSMEFSMINDIETGYDILPVLDVEISENGTDFTRVTEFNHTVFYGNNGKYKHSIFMVTKDDETDLTKIKTIRINGILFGESSEEIS